MSEVHAGLIARARAWVRPRLETWELDQRRPDLELADIDRVRGTLVTIAALVLGVRSGPPTGRSPQPGVPPAPALPATPVWPAVAADPSGSRNGLVLGTIGFLVTTGGLLGSLAVSMLEANAGGDPAYLPLVAPTALAGFLVGLSARRATLAGGIAAWASIFASVILLDLNGIPPFDDDPEQWVAFIAIILAVPAAGILGISSLIGWGVARLRR